MDHRRDVLGAVGRPIDRRELGGVARITDGDPAEALDPLGEQVDDLGLLLGVLVEQQVELVEGRPGHEPVVLLVERVEDHRVGEDLVEQLAALGPCLLRQGDGQQSGRPEALDLDAQRRELRLRRHARRSADDDPLPWVFTLVAMFDTSVRSDRPPRSGRVPRTSLADEAAVLGATFGSSTVRPDRGGTSFQLHCNPRPWNGRAGPYTARHMRSTSILPDLAWVRSYRRGYLRKDVIAGLVLTAILVPAGMGYAEASGLPPIVGLYASIVPLLAYALLGPSRILVLGPDSSLVPLIAAAVVPLAAGDEDAGGHPGGPPRGHHRGDRHRGGHGAARLPDRPAVRACPGRLPQRHRPDRDRRPAAQAVRLQRRCGRPGGRDRVVRGGADGRRDDPGRPGHRRRVPGRHPRRAGVGARPCPAS